MSAGAARVRRAAEGRKPEVLRWARGHHCPLNEGCALPPLRGRHLE